MLDSENRAVNSFQPLFIIGAARSGTKLLRDLIARHPVVECVPFDVNYIWRLGHESLEHDELLPQDLTQEQAQHIQDQMARYHTGAPLLVEKTVSNCLRVPYVNAVFPDGKFIHLVRDGRDVIESAHRQWLAPPDWRYIIQKSLSYPLVDAFGYASAYARNTVRKIIGNNKSGMVTWGPRYRSIDQDLTEKSVLEVCAIQWARCVQAAANELACMPSNKALTIVYEEFVNDPGADMIRIANFLDLDPDPFNIALQQTPISTENVGNAQRRLDPEELEMIMPYIEDSLHLLNYA